ncbi:hypothetical protein T01_10748 [Trichinella spiralis]|uniref:Uncharacterized protein n=1 Tax=Trichinella spiralis TaxID=6334 RepID=A0A0V1A681_TRISP|nr:hypothetical protein T01_10748 [Trichinella spiralis]
MSVIPVNTREALLIIAFHSAITNMSGLPIALQGIYTVNRYTNSGKQLLLPILRISTRVSPHRCQVMLPLYGL